MQPRWLLLICLIWLVPARAHSAIYYVAKTGSNSNSCNQAQSVSTPKLTIGAALACLSGSDTLIINAGVYAEAIINTIPSGTSTSNRTRVLGLNGARWTLQPSSTSQCFNDAGALYLKDKNFIEIADMIADGKNCTANMGALFWIAGTSHDDILRNAELKNLKNATGLLFQSGTTSRITVSHVLSHDHGQDSLDHCFYPSGSNHIFEHVEAYNCSGYGMHLYNRTGGANNNNIIRWSYFHDNGASGILIGSGSNNIAENNVVRNNGERSREGGITVGFHTAHNNQVYDNTIVGNSGHCIVIRRGSTNSKVMRNVCWQNGNDSVRDWGNVSIISNTRVINPLTDATGAPVFSRKSRPLEVQKGQRH
jgi:Right handed beta helix region